MRNLVDVIWDYDKKYKKTLSCVDAGGNGWWIALKVDKKELRQIVPVVVVPSSERVES